MTTIKKKYLKNYKPKAEIDELVDADGSPIEGDEVHNNDTEIWTAPQQTGDEFALQSNQPSRFRYGVDGSPYSHGSRKGTLNNSKETDGEELNEKEDIDEAANLMRKMVEDVLTKNLQDNGVVNRSVNPDVNRNDIPDIDELSNTTGNPVAVGHAKIFIDDINKIPLKGDEKGIILNYILSNFNTSDISPDYKNILRKKI